MQRNKTFPVFLKELQKNLEQNDLSGINENLKTILAKLYTSEVIQSDVIKAFFDNFDVILFRNWLHKQSLLDLGENLAVRCLALIRQFPVLSNYDYLYREFLQFINRADQHLNPSNITINNIFAALIETITGYIKFPSDENVFYESIINIEQSIKDKIEKLKESKAELPIKNAEYLLLVNEHDPLDTDKIAQLMFEILLAEKELRQFLFAGVEMPMPYLIYFIALDEVGHFSPIIQQAALSSIAGRQSLHCADKTFLWKKCTELRSDFFTVYNATAVIAPDTTAKEFAYSIKKALNLLGIEYDYASTTEIAHALLEKIPDCRDFLYHFPVKISNNPGEKI